MDGCKVSIIVPVYNTAKWLPRCVESIMGQTFGDFELLLVNDGSSDNSGAICEEYAEKDSRIRVFHKENGGVSSARNVGLDHARGEWVTFVDSDDELMATGLQTMLGCVEDEVEMVMAGYETFNEYGNRVYQIEEKVSVRQTNEEAMMQLYSPLHYRYYGYVWGKLMRKWLIDEHEIRFAKDVSFNEDRLFLTQYLCGVKGSVCYTTMPVYKYYEVEGGAMKGLSRGFNKKYISDLVASERMRNLIMEHFKDEELLEMADYGVYASYRRIADLMHKFHYKEAGLKSELRQEVVEAIGHRRLMAYEVSHQVQKTRKRIKRISKRVIGEK